MDKYYYFNKKIIYTIISGLSIINYIFKDESYHNLKVISIEDLLSIFDENIQSIFKKNNPIIKINYKNTNLEFDTFNEALSYKYEIPVCNDFDHNYSRFNELLDKIKEQLMEEDMYIYLDEINDIITLREQLNKFKIALENKYNSLSNSLYFDNFALNRCRDQIRVIERILLQIEKFLH